MNELARIVSLADFRNHIEAALEVTDERFRRDMLEEQLHECNRAVEHALNGHRSTDRVWFNPFYVSDDDLILSLGG